ncbi:hypothetical protein [Streptomyces sp. NBRC 110611]|uniref:hypothetical protein n=1 Tax=Streptomyces sp. NBRC 110611 TaxID=1621259 RepID=UPI0011BF9273|nr:hypothetical protein [Streptomyces sp. NBRC 110611]
MSMPLPLPPPLPHTPPDALASLASLPLPTPPRCEVPHFAPVRAGSGRLHWVRAARRRMLTAGLALTAAALAGVASYGAVRTPPAAGCPSMATPGGR